jgi:hypothetical protein
MEFDMLWVRQEKARNRPDGSRHVRTKGGEIPAKILYRGPRATDDAGPGSGGGSKVRILREDTLEETYVYARNLKPRRR